jgi:hypothetical protein
MASLRRLGSSLLFRIALGLAAVGLIPLGFAAWQLVGLNRDAMTEQVLRSHIVAARTAADRAASFVATRSALATAAAADPQLATGDAASAGAALGRALQSWSDLGVLAVALANDAGAEVVRAQVSEAAAATAAAIDQALAPAPSRGAIAAHGSGEDLVLVFDAPAAEVRGFVRLVVSGRDLAAALHPEEIGEQADIVLAESGGRVLAGSISSLDGFPPDLVTAALSGRALGAQEDYRDAGGNRFLGAYAPVPAAGWSVLSRQPTAIAEAVAMRMRQRALAAVAGAGVLILLLAAGAYAALVRPLRRLTEAQRRLAKSTQAGATADDGDEVAQLAASFAALEKSISDRDALSKIFLGRYQVVDLLGGGGMGTVFRGWDPKLQRPLALKTVRLHRALEASARQPLLQGLIREAVTVARFQHPHIVAVYDVQDHPSGAFIAMEFVDGMSLEALLRREHRLALGRALPLGLAVARALDAAHTAKVVHRDIKPANILLGGNGDIKVTDFGIAEFLRRADGAEANLQRAVGSPGYVPPEALQGKGFDRRGDLFALGALLYRVTTGTPAFPGDDAKAILRRTLRGEIRTPRSLDPSIPIELEALLLALLERDPERRPASAMEVIENLEHLVHRHAARWEPPAPSAAAT